MTSIRKTFFSGIMYIAITKYSGVIFSIAIAAILARLLSPAEFGVVALITVFISFFNILSDAGIGPAIVQNKELVKEDIQSIFIFTVLLGVILGLLFYFLSRPIASFYDNEELIPLIKLLSIAVLFNTFRIVPNALLLKKLKFKQIGVITITVQLLSGISSIILAYSGFSYYALIFKSVFDSVFIFILFYWLSPVKFRFKIEIEAINKIIRFSTFQFLFNFINYFSRNMDNLLIGKFINPIALAYYDKSYQVMMMPVLNLTHVISPVLQPVLSDFQDDKNRICEIYLKVVKLLATIGIPLSVFLYFSAYEIIYVLYGLQWEQSVSVFKILALTVGIQIVLTSSGAIFQVLNRTDLLFYSGMLSAVVMVCCICFGVFVGGNLESVGYALIVAFSVNFFQVFYMLIKVGLESSFLKFLKIFVYPLFVALCIGISLFWFIILVSFENYYFILVAKIVVSLFLFLCCNLINPSNRKLILEKVKKLKT